MLLLLTSLLWAAPPWAADLATGDCQSVSRALTAPANDLERLALGRCQAEQGQTGAALELLQPLRSGELAPYAALLRGKALLERGKPKEAEVELALAPASAEVTLLRGRALVEDKRSLEARDMLRGLLEGPQAAEARYWLAVGAQDRADTVNAIGTLQAVWTRHPTSPWAEKASKMLLDHGIILPDFSSTDGRSLAMARAKTLLQMRLAHLALPLLDAIHTQDPFDTASEQLFMAEALFDARQYQRAVEWYARGGAENSASTYFSYALATARGGDYAAAAEIYQDVAAKYPGTSQADEAIYKIPYMAFDAKNWAEAIAGFDVYKQRNPKGKFLTDARWFSAWATYKLRGAEAVPAFEAVISGGGDAERVVAARYWKARLQNDEAALRKLLSDSPTSPYAWFVQQRLGIAAPPLAEDPAAPAFPAGFVEARPTLKTAMLLLDGGMADWARPLLNSHVAAAKSAGKDASIAMAWVLLSAEDYQGAKDLAAPYCSSSPAARAACYPRPHHATVQSLAAEAGLDPLLPYAIMNAESGLNPSVTSPAGARGLMQLMPQLAADLAVDLPNFHVDQLYHAGVNARLGTRELGQLQRQFQNASIQPTLPLVIAGYNGGSAAVERWLGSYSQRPPIDEFCEEISFTETRRYVRRVLGYLMQYRRAYGG